MKIGCRLRNWTTANSGDTFYPSYKLFFPSVVETLVNDPDVGGIGPIISQTEESTLTVVAVDEEVTVEAGTFTTIHTSTVLPDGTVDSWTDVDTGILVKNEVRNAESQVVSSTELVSLN